MDPKEFMEMMTKSNDFSRFMMKMFNQYKETHVEASNEQENPLCSQPMDKGIIEKNSMIELGKYKTQTQFVDTPSYEQIFRPPKIIDRDPSKLYGRMLLRKHYEDQHKILSANYSRVRSWFKDMAVGDMRHNPIEQKRVKDLIHAKIHDIQPLCFPGATYTWREEDIYIWILSLKQCQRKYQKRKMSMSSCSTNKVRNSLLY